MIHVVCRRSAPLIVLVASLMLFSAFPASAQGTPKNDPWAIWIILLALTAFCAALAGWMFYTARKYGALAKASKTWPTAPGKVIESRVDARHHAKSGYSYLPIVVYEYLVSGTRYESSVIEFGLLELPTEKSAQERIKDRPVGAMVTVRYQPDEPKTATLDTSSAMATGRRVGGWAAVVTWGVIMGTLLYFI